MFDYVGCGKDHLLSQLVHTALHLNSLSLLLLTLDEKMFTKIVQWGYAVIR